MVENVEHSELTGKKLEITFSNIYECFMKNYCQTSKKLIDPFCQSETNYEMLHRVIDTLEQSFAALDLKYGDPVSLFVSNGTERIACILALAKFGIPFVPLEPILPKDSIEHIIHKTHVKLVIIGEQHGYHDKWDDYQISTVNTITVQRLLNMSPEAPKTQYSTLCEVQGTDIFCILATSGSTGKAKCVKLSHRNILNRLSWYWHEFPFGSNEMCCSKTTFIFVDFLTETLSAVLLYQDCLFLQRDDIINIPKLIHDLKAYSVTRLVVVPSLLKSMIIEISKTSNYLLKLRYVISSGDLLPKNLITAFFHCFVST